MTALKGAKILVVEDEGLVSHDIALRLRRAGCSVTGIAASAAEAIEQAEAARPDLVLMDIRIQGETDGIAAAEWMRARFHLPVLFLTAHSDPDTVSRALVAQPYGYVTKPIRQHALTAAVSAAIERCRAESASQSQGVWMAAVLKSVSDSIFVLTGAGRILGMNAAAEKLTGFSASEALAELLTDVLPIHDPSTGIHFATSAIFALATGETVPLQMGLRAVRRSGAEIAVEGEVSPGSPDGALAGHVVLTLRDATNRQELLKAEEFRERAAVLGRLTKGVARQIDRSLGDVPGLLDQLQAVTPGSAFPVMSELRRRVDTLAGTSRKLTELLRVQAVPLEAFDVNRLLVEQNASWRSALPPGATLSLKTAKKLPRVKASAAALDLILRELVENACEAMHPFPASVEIETECIELPPQARSASPETYVVLTVRDWGPGVQPEIRDQIFDPYFSTRPEQNRGLGLAVAAEIVSGLGGFIEGEACEPGFAFHVCLPVRRSPRVLLPNYGGAA